TARPRPALRDALSNDPPTQARPTPPAAAASSQRDAPTGTMPLAKGASARSIDQADAPPSHASAANPSAASMAHDVSETAIAIVTAAASERVHAAAASDAPTTRNARNTSPAKAIAVSQMSR